VRERRLNEAGADEDGRREGCMKVSTEEGLERRMAKFYQVLSIACVGIGAMRVNPTFAWVATAVAVVLQEQKRKWRRSVRLMNEDVDVVFDEEGWRLVYFLNIGGAIWVIILRWVPL